MITGLDWFRSTKYLEWKRPLGAYRGFSLASVYPLVPVCALINPGADCREAYKTEGV